MDSECENDISDVGYSSHQKSKKPGGFQSLGLDHNVLKGILRRGYKIPTPIQRKTIPLILSGKDVFAMARTGSGKTAAFLVPLLQKLKVRSAKAGARAVLISPTRELAIQTLKFTKELGKYTNLRVCLLVGGDKMEEQFASIHENPDIIIATPGRLVHVAVEMNLKLTSVEYVVFDEADRLFEMGFEEQLREILARLPDNRQTLLFSATLPNNLMDFIKAGLNDPVLVRLDVDSKISEKLKMSFLFCRFEDKIPALTYLLRHVIDTDCEQSLIFCATKHHVEYLADILSKLSFSCTYLYSSLDPAARKINIDKFRKKKAQILVVTDLAARGVDIPLLDNVINLHFPAKAKLFVHRVGRVARAGRSGRAFNIISAEEMPYVLDLFLFLGRCLKLMKQDGVKIDNNDDDVLGGIPRSLLEVEEEFVRNLHDGNADLEFLRQGCSNAYKQYVRTRPTPSRESVERVKRENVSKDLLPHPIFGKSSEEIKVEESKSSILDGLKNYKPKITVFELNTSNRDACYVSMKAMRKSHSKFIRDCTSVKNDDDHPIVEENVQKNGEIEYADPSCSEVKNVFSEIIEAKFRENKTAEKISLKNRAKKAKKEEASKKDAEYFIPYQPKDFHQEKALSLQKSAFERDASDAVVDFTHDEASEFHRQKNALKWDRKRKKFVREGDGKNKKIKTESGVWIPASYKTDLYSKWLKKSKYGSRDDDDDDANDNGREEKDFRIQTNVKGFGRRGRFGNQRTANNDAHAPTKVGRKSQKMEIKSKDQMLKERKRKDRIHAHQSFKRSKTVQRSSKARGGGTKGRGRRK